MGGCDADGQLIESKFGNPLPTIGLYIVVASLYCAGAMGLDTLRGFRSNRLWFPSKYFTLDAATLTVLAVATKLPVDLNTAMPRPMDQLCKLSGTVLICTVIGNLIPSLGVPNNPTSNIVALGILVVTVIVNVGIQMGTGVIYVFVLENILILFSMLVLLVLFISSALTVPSTKRQLEKQYDQKHLKMMADELPGAVEQYDATRLCHEVKKRWLMAHTGSPQYVLGRSATCTASGLVCLLSAFILIEASVRSLHAERSRFCEGTSDYKWSIVLVFFSQVIAVVVGTIAPAYRWFNAVSFRSLEGSWRCKDEFRVEKYWVEKLTEWQDSPLHLQFRSRRCRKISHNSKNLILCLLINVQRVVVLASKGVRLVFILPVRWLNHGNRKLENFPSSVSGADPLRSRDLQGGAESGEDPVPSVPRPNFDDFVLYLEGEEDLVKVITRNERKDVERWIQKGRNKRPTHLASLIKDYTTRNRGFIGVALVDSDEVSHHLVPEDRKPENCWVLPLVTLASIAVALAGVDHQASLKTLLSGVEEGLRYVRQVEKNLEAKGLLNQRKAAEIVWSRLNFRNRWFDSDLRGLALEFGSSREILKKLKEVGGGCVREFLEGGASGGIDTAESSLDWPPNVLAANCMYRLASTILQRIEREPLEEQRLFDLLSRAISDLLGACLTNLPRAIYLECFCNPVEVREERVRLAALLLGEAEDIMALLADEEAASFYPEKKVYLDDWRQKAGSSLRSRSSGDFVRQILASSSSRNLGSNLSTISLNSIASSISDESVSSSSAKSAKRPGMAAEDMV